MIQSGTFNELEREVKDSSQNIRCRAVLFTAVLLAVCCAGLAVGVWAHNRSTSKASGLLPKPTSNAQPPSISTAPGSTSLIQRLDIEVITIRPTGFERTQITRPRGLFGIAVENRSGLMELTLRLDQEGGPRLREAQLTSQKLNWKDRFDLLPGRYLLKEASHPDWACGITITE